MEIPATAQRKYSERFLLAFSTTSLLVVCASIAVGGHGQDALGLAAGTIAILIFALQQPAFQRTFYAETWELYCLPKHSQL